MNNILIIILIIAILITLLLHFQSRKKQLKVLPEKPSPKPMVYKPKSEKDCPCCQANHPQKTVTHQPPVVPWSQIKGKGGRKKTIATEGYFCSTECCDYFGITDQDIHAVVGNGRRGKAELIQYLKCNVCTDRFTSRKHTVMYRLKTPSEKVWQTLHLTVLGIDIAAIQDFIQIRESTIRTWLTRRGEHGQKLHDRFVTGLKPKHIQLDELWASVKNSEQDVWVWTVCDATTKLMPNSAAELLPWPQA